MQDKDEELRELRQKVEEMEEELGRKQKQIQSLKKTNKIQEQHIELQRRKLVDSENKKTPSMVVPDEESQEIKKLKEKLEAVEKEKNKFEKNNREKQRQYNQLKQNYDELSAIGRAEVQKLHL